jgi:Arc/MetJ-type ribon-helix-helix transcriptional regulator
MAKDNVRQPRSKGPESEKITVNLGYVDLGQIDLLVDEGFYSNRTDFIRTAIRNQIARQADFVHKAVTRHSLDLGLRLLDRQELEAARAAGQQLDLRVLGLLTISPDISAKLARATISSITVLGALHANAEVKAALADRIR